MQVAIITQAQKTSLEGVLIAPSTYFNLQMYDVNGNVCIDSDSINLCNIQWLKDLPFIEYVPPIIENPFI
jgi:hypothetical protein